MSDDERSGQVEFLVETFGVTQKRAEDAIDAAIWAAYKNGYHAPLSEAVSLLAKPGTISLILQDKLAEKLDVPRNM